MSDLGENQEHLLQYYLRTGYFHKVQELCLQRGGYRDSFSFWKATALWLEGREREAIREMEKVADSREFGFPAARALVAFNSLVQNPDFDVIRRYQEKSADGTEDGKINAGYLYLHMEDLRQAREIADQLEVSRSTATFLAWLRYRENSGTKKQVQPSRDICKECMELLEEHCVAADQHSNFRLDQLEALMLKAKLCEGMRNWGPALEYLNQVIVYFPWYLPAIKKSCITGETCDRWMRYAFPWMNDFFDREGEIAGRYL